GPWWVLRASNRAMAEFMGPPGCRVVARAERALVVQSLVLGPGVPIVRPIIERHRAGDLPLTPAARSRSGGRTTAARRGAQPWSSRDGQETSSRAAAVYALVTSRVKSACAAATVATQSTLVASAAFS